MLGLMQRRELMIASMLQHAARHHGDTDIVSRRDDGRIDRTTYAAVWERTRRLGALLRMLGVKPGDRVATLAMNSDRHLELYYAITGIGAICNTINPRLSPDDIGWIAAHAEDGLIFADPIFLPIVQQIAPDPGSAIARRHPAGGRSQPPAGLRPASRCRPPCVRDTDGVGPAADRLRQFRRKHRGAAVLHLGHDRPTERRALLAPLYRIARHGA